MGIFLGMDIGGSSLKIGAWDGASRIAWKDSIALPESGADQAVKQHLLDVINEFIALNGIEPAGLGIGSCGVISGGRIFQSPNTPWNRLPLVPLLQPELGWPVSLLNDADAFLVYALASLPDSKAVVLGITLGTGVGTALWTKDRLYAGGAGISPEGGHITIDLDAAAGTSGIPGTWESMACRDAVLRYFAQAGGEGAKDPRDVANLAENGDGPAISAWNRFGTMVGVGLASLCNFLSPDYVMIGGGLAGARRLFEQSLAAAMEQHMLRALPQPELKFFDEQPDSVAMGAMRFAAGMAGNAV